MTNGTGEIVHFKGRPVTELSKEELIEAVTVAVRMLEEERDFHAKAEALEEIMRRWGLYDGSRREDPASVKRSGDKQVAEARADKRPKA